MKMLKVFAMLALFSTSNCFAQAAQQPEAGSAETILQSYVEDFRHDPSAMEPVTFAVRIRGEGGAEWHVIVEGKKAGVKEAEVSLRKGLPSKPTFLYTTDLPTLQKLDRGELNALTVMGRARDSDPVPMDIEFMPGFQPGPSFFAQAIPLTFHFWTRGFPEVIPFGRKYSRVVHGGNITVLFYQKGLRSAWLQLEKGQHVNQDPKDQVNEFPSLLIGIRGRAIAKIGGQETKMETGAAIFIPAGVTHELWNPGDEPAEAILIMFGEGS